MDVSDPGSQAGAFAAQLRVMRPGIEPPLEVGLRVAGTASEVVKGRPDDEPEFVIYDAISGNVLPGAPHDVVIETTNGAWEISASVDEYGTVELWFDDESTVKLYADGGDDDPYILDDGAALLEPITQTEHAAIERLLSVLGEARDAGRLTTWQEDQIILMADLIRAARDEAVPEETERWKVIGVVGGALRYLARELPEDVVKWGAAGLVLSNIDWHNLAAALPG